MGRIFLLCVFLTLASVASAYNKYEDAMAKYKKWQQKHGGSVQIRRDPRQAASATKRIGKPNSLFTPHRPTRQGGKQFQPAQVSQNTNLFGFRGELPSPSLVRGTRGNAVSNQIGLGGAEYVSPHGTPIYMLRKRNPLYGRRKRRSAQQGWTILDPNTGRPVSSSNSLGSAEEGLGNSITVQRQTRNPEPQTLNDFYSQTVASPGAEYLRSDGSPLYKSIKSSPYRGRRSVQRVARSADAQGWSLLDPATGRPVKQEKSELPPNIRHARRPSSTQGLSKATDPRTWTNAEGVAQPIYKYYKKYPFGYSG